MLISQNSFLFQDITCIKDLNSLYEAATVGDLYLAYDQLKIDESSLYSCIGVAGAQAGEDIAGKDRPSSVIWFSFFVLCGLLLSIYNENGNGATNNGKGKDATRLIHLLAGTKLETLV